MIRNKATQLVICAGEFPPSHSPKKLQDPLKHSKQADLNKHPKTDLYSTLARWPVEQRKQRRHRQCRRSGWGWGRWWTDHDTDPTSRFCPSGSWLPTHGSSGWRPPRQTCHSHNILLYSTKTTQKWSPRRFPLDFSKMNMELAHIICTPWSHLANTLHAS